MNTVLHIINKPASQAGALMACLRVAGPEDALLLIENGVYNALDNAINRRALDGLANPLYVLAPDLKARGFNGEDIIHGIEQVDYRGFVDLTVQHPLSVSW